jgi:hypothetical protein
VIIPRTDEELAKLEIIVALAEGYGLVERKFRKVSVASKTSSAIAKGVIREDVISKGRHHFGSVSLDDMKSQLKPEMAYKIGVCSAGRNSVRGLEAF